MTLSILPVELQFYLICTKAIYSLGKFKERVRARSVLCYWAVRELEETKTEIAKELGITQPAVSLAVKRGEKLVMEMGLEGWEKQTYNLMDVSLSRFDG